MTASKSLKWCLRILSILAILSLLPWAPPGMAQELPPPEIAGLEPREGWPGEQVQAEVWGNDFDEEVEVIIDGLETEVIRRSAERLAVQIFVPSDAPPGPRDVIVVNRVGPAQEDRLPGGFVVLGERDREAPFRVALEGIDPPHGEVGQRLDVMLW